MTESEKPGTITGKGCALLVLGMFVVLSATLFACSALGSSGGSRPPSDAEAKRVCQEWVREKLKAPSTAEFSETVVTSASGQWSVRGIVDAENTFGAKIRTQWTCEVRLDGDTWRGEAQLAE